MRVAVCVALVTVLAAVLPAAGRELWPTLLDRHCAGVDQRRTTSAARRSAPPADAHDQAPPPRDV